jgi:DNA-binding NtrC family response regulator
MNRLDGTRILVVEDEDVLRRTLLECLRSVGVVTDGAENGAQAMDLVRSGTPFDAVLLDYKLPDACGLDLLRKIKRLAPDTNVILMTGFSSVQVAVQAMKSGAADYATKPVNTDVLLRMIVAAIDQKAPSQRGSAISAHADERADEPLHGSGKGAVELVGVSEATRALRALIVRIAASPIGTVLVTGESGTGKDIVARALHHGSPRRARQFVNITCSAIPESLLESELFGHEAGAFTSAGRRKRGLLDLAAGGTVFLDEVAEMSPSLQAKLLRFLEERAFRPVGGTRDVHVDVRVVAATNRDLAEEVKAGRFRADLYYRLRVVRIHLVPLRDRVEDIQPIARHFLGEIARTLGRDATELDASAIACLENHQWPGNVRELKHTLESAVLLGNGGVLTAEDCAPNERPSGEYAFRLPPDGLVLEHLERSLLLQALEAANWNQVRAGKLLGLNRDQVRYRIEKFGLEQRSKREDPTAA